MDRSRDGKYLAAQLCRQFGGDERATALCGLNDEGALAEGGDQAVAHGKMKGTRPLVEGILTQQQSLRGDLMGQLAISSRDRKSTRLNSSHVASSSAVFC